MRIVPSLQHLKVPVEALTPHPMNPNEGDVGAIAHQLTEHGQHTPIVVQAGTGVILAGNHRWTAAVQLGWTHIAAVEVEADDDRALEIMVGDNRPHRVSRDDPDRLEGVLHRLQDEGVLSRAGYDASDLDDLVRRRLTPDGPMVFDAPIPTISIRVPPPVFELWCAVCAARGGTEGEAFADVLAGWLDG